MSIKILKLISLIFIVSSCADKIELRLTGENFCVIDINDSKWIDDLYLYKIDSLDKTICLNKITRIKNFNEYTDTICLFSENVGYKSNDNYCSIEKGFKYKIVASNPGFEDDIIFIIDDKDNIVVYEKNY